MKTKNYIETEASLEWLAKNVPKQKESLFIREAVSMAIAKLEKLSTLQQLRKLRRYPYQCEKSESTQGKTHAEAPLLYQT